MADKDELDKAETVRLQPMGSPEAGKNGGPLTDDSEYDPHLHRQVEKPTSDFETLIHLLKCSLGTGILAMPQSFARAGLVVGTVATVIVGILITYCLHLLVKCQYKLCKRKRVPLLTYPEAMDMAFSTGPPSFKRFAKPSACMVDIFLVIYQLGICCVYVLFIANTLKKMINVYHVMSLEIYMIIILGPIICINLIRNLKVLAPFSTLANVITFIGLGVVVYFVTTEKKLSESKLDLWGSTTEFPLFFGTVLFALTAVGVVVALENNMKTPKSFGKPFGVLNTGMAIIVVLYIGMGVLGYLFCIDKCSDSITLDLPQNALSTSVNVLFMIAIFISYALQCYVPVDIIWNTYTKPKLIARGSQKLLLWEYGLRVVLCILTFILAYAIPLLGLFISLFGAFCLSALGICFPALMEICIAFPDKYGIGKSILLKDIFLFIFGIIGLVAGTYASLLAIIQALTT